MSRDRALVPFTGRVKARAVDLDLLEDYPPPRTTQGTIAGRSALVRSAAFVCMVRDEGPDATGAYLDALDRAQLYALTVTLAAMVPDDVPAAELLAWVPIPPTAADLEATG